MPDREAFDANGIQVDQIDDHIGGVRQAADAKHEHMPTSVDFSVFASRPITRPTINRYIIYDNALSLK